MNIQQSAESAAHQHLNSERIKLLGLINFNKDIISAKGHYLYDADGTQYLDFTSQYGAVPFGHNPDFIWKGILEQSNIAPGNMIQPFESQSAKKLAKALINIAPGDMQNVVFACSGTEAVETALRMAFAKTKRPRILSTLGGYHGKTMGACMATGNPYFREAFFEQNPDFVQVPYDDLDAIEAALSSGGFAALLLEPIQGEGGANVPSEGYLKGAERICRKYDTLFIVDEIQTGLGRTGEMFACAHEKVSPDILLLSKSLGGGMLPLSACLANSSAWSKEFGLRHSSTFANYGLGCTVGLKVIEKLTQDPTVIANIRRVGQYMADMLQNLVLTYPEVFLKTSGMGMMQGIAFQGWEDNADYFTIRSSELGFSVPLISGYILNRHKIVTLPTLNARRVMRIQPDYLMSQTHVDQLEIALRDVAECIRHDEISEFFRSAMALNPATRQPRSGTTSKPTPPRNKVIGPKPLGKFAFLVHPTSDADIIGSITAGSQSYSPSEYPSIMDWRQKVQSAIPEPGAVHHVPRLKSVNGGHVEGWIIGTMNTPREMMRMSRGEKSRLLSQYIDVAKEKGVDMVGLGAFTSVISRSGSDLVDCGLPITTGNAYTALSSTESLRKLCMAKAMPLNAQHLGIVGALGSVGRLCLLDLGAECSAISLIGNARNSTNIENLERLAGEFLVTTLGDINNTHAALVVKLAERGVNVETLGAVIGGDYIEAYRAAKRIFEMEGAPKGHFPIHLSNDVNKQLPACSIVITATSNGSGFIQPQALSPNSIICDVARPSDLVDEICNTRRDITVYAGGIVKLPEHIRFGTYNVVGLETGLSLACLSETIILTMEQQSRNFSVGGNSPLSDAREIFSWGEKHGFRTFLPEGI